MIILANILIYITVITLFMFPIVMIPLLVGIIHYDARSKQLPTNIKNAHLFSIVFLPFGLGLLQYCSYLAKHPSDGMVNPSLKTKRDFLLTLFKILTIVMFVMISLSFVLHIYNNIL